MGLEGVGGEGFAGGEEGAEKTKYRGVEGEGEGVVGDEEDAESEREERGDGERRVGFGM